MDLSVEYKEMVEAASEIQKYYEDNAEKMHYFGENKMSFFKYSAHEMTFHKPEEQRWIPRQDQLQMIFNDHDLKTLKRKMNPVTLLGLFTYWVFNSGLMLWTEETTLEMLWLMYIMKEIHNKEWDNKTKTWNVVSKDTNLLLDKLKVKEK